MTPWHVVTCEFPPRHGGVSDYTRRLAEALANAGDEVHVWGPGEAPDVMAGRVHVHAALGAFGWRDLSRVGERLDRFPRPRRLLVQWVPHGYGWRSMNVPFCLWLAARARGGDRVELVVHEACLELQPRPVRHLIMACVHRLMITVLLRAATHVWLATPSWEPLLRPFSLGRQVPMSWLPISGCDQGRAEVRRPRPTPRGRVPLIGHFGTYGQPVAGPLERRLLSVMALAVEPAVLLIGAGSDVFRAGIVARYPALASRIHATGVVDESAIGGLMAECDLFVQPYPDGVTCRRTSLMTCLARGVPVVTTSGRLTEALWAESGAVAMADAADVPAFTAIVNGLIGDAGSRGRLGAQGQALYRQRFDIGHAVRLLRGAVALPAVRQCA